MLLCSVKQCCVLTLRVIVKLSLSYNMLLFIKIPIQSCFALSYFFMLSVSAVHHLITISRFLSHFSFSTLAKRIVTTIRTPVLTKEKTEWKEKNTRLYRIQFKCLQKTVYSGHQKIKYYNKVSQKKFTDRNIMTESNLFLKNVVDSKKEKEENFVESTAGMNKTYSWLT